MTKDELVKELVEVDVVIVIGGAYFITEKYKELLVLDAKKIPVLVAEPAEPGKYTIAEVNEVGEHNGWPASVMQLSGRARATHIIDDLIKVPITPKNGTYFLNVVSSVVYLTLNKYIKGDVNGIIFIEALSAYYKFVEMPKSFKNALIEGDALQIYTLHSKGKLMPALRKGISGQGGDNKKWG